MSCESDDDAEIDDTADEISFGFRKTYNMPDSTVRINSIAENADGSFILAGALEPYRNFIMKIDENGGREWTSAMNNSVTARGLEFAFIEGSTITSFQSSNLASGDLPSMIKYNLAGEFLDETLITNSIKHIGDVIKEDSYFIAAGPSSNDMAVQRINSNGTVAWTKVYDQNVPILSIAKLNDGNYISLGGGGSY